DRQTKWGAVRAQVADAIKNKKLKLKPDQIRAWERIWKRWEQEEVKLAQTLVLERPTVSHGATAFDTAFTNLLKKDGELAAIWGFAAKSFIPAEEKEEYYLRQFQRIDSVEKMKMKDVDFVIRWTVLEPAIESGRAHDLRDAIQMWELGLLYDLIDVDR